MHAIFAKRHSALAILQTPLHNIINIFTFLAVRMRIPFTYKTALFVILSFMCLSFLIFQSGVRAYLDASYQFSMSTHFYNWSQNLFNITGHTWSGDWTQIASGRYIRMAIEIGLKSMFGIKRGAIVLYFSYFLINYVSSKKVFALFGNPEHAYIGALLYTFNPVSIYMLNQVGFLYVYSAIPLIIYGFYIYFYEKNKNFLGLLLCGFGTISLTGYTRFMLIYIIFLIIVCLFYYRDIRQLWLTKTYKCIGLCVFLFCVNLPFVFSVLYPYYSGEYDYFSGVANYASVFKDFGSVMYRQAQDIPLSKLIVPVEPTSNFGYTLSNNRAFIYFSFLYFSAVVFFLLYKQPHLHKKHARLLSIGVINIVLGISFRILPHYVSENIFIYTSYELLPFLANTSAFSYRFILSGLSMILPLCLMYASRILRIAISLGAVAYCFVVASTLFFFQDNNKLHTIDISQNSTIADIFTKQSDIAALSGYAEGSLVYPSTNILFDRAPYPIPIDNVSGISPGIEGNERTTTPKKMAFSRYLSQLAILDKHIENLGLLSIESFVVIQNISSNPDKKQFDFYNESDYPDQAKVADEMLMQNSGVVISTSNSLYTKYDIANKHLFSFSIYLPQSIVLLSGYENLLDVSIDLTNRPLVLDNAAYNKPTYIDSGYIIPNTSGQNIEIKTNAHIPFAYYIKISNVVSGQDILLQFNKTFGMHWKLKHINKYIYEKKLCNNKTYYPVSNNTLCYAGGKFPTLREFADTLLSQKYTDIDHFEGNFMGNTRVLKDVETLDGELYILISNEKQYLYIISQIIASVILCLILIGSLYTVFSTNKSGIGKNI